MKGYSCVRPIILSANEYPEVRRDEIKGFVIVRKPIEERIQNTNTKGKKRKIRLNFFLV